jgi:hypothetical protein
MRKNNHTDVINTDVGVVNQNGETKPAHFLDLHEQCPLANGHFVLELHQVTVIK